MQTLTVVLEKGKNGTIVGWIENDIGGLSPRTIASSVEAVKDKIMMLIKDHIDLDGEKADAWRQVIRDGYIFEYMWNQAK